MHTELRGRDRKVVDVYGRPMGVISRTPQGWVFQPLIGSHLYGPHKEYWEAAQDARRYEVAYVIPIPPQGRIAE